MANKPVLVTLTAPSCAGKSHLLNHIRNEAKLPCLVSTTTRSPRKGEIEGVDYFFITEERSKEIEVEDGFAELAIYNGTRYGVTNEEFKSKLDMGLAFLIVEPTGIDHYVKPALDAGAAHLKYFIEVPLEVRLERFKKRVDLDLQKTIDECQLQATRQKFYSEGIKQVVNTALARQKTMLTEELTWQRMTVWDGILSGLDAPVYNLQRILLDVKSLNRS